MDLSSTLTVFVIVLITCIAALYYQSRNLVGQEKIDNLIFQNELYKLIVAIETTIIAFGVIFGSNLSSLHDNFLISFCAISGILQNTIMTKKYAYEYGFYK